MNPGSRRHKKCAVFLSRKKNIKNYPWENAINQEINEIASMV